jgi:hypothetical protein
MHTKPYPRFSTGSTDRAISRTGILILAILFCLLMIAAESRAFCYRPTAAIRILSEYTAIGHSTPSSPRVWEVVPETGPDGSTTLRFYQQGGAHLDAVCVLMLPPCDSAGTITWTGIGKINEKRSDTGLLLVPGFPAPSDVLPLSELDSGKIYQEKVAAGGRVFSKRYRVEWSSFDISEAKAMGWIKADDPGASALIMVTVTDEKGKPLVRQLWPIDGLWWLYEETPLRRSWLMD